jgi:hypothetical protein
MIQRPKITVDARLFGAKGDGIHDDSEAIREAVKAADFLSALGFEASIWFPTPARLEKEVNLT